MLCFVGGWANKVAYRNDACAATLVLLFWMGWEERGRFFLATELSDVTSSNAMKLVMQDDQRGFRQAQTGQLLFECTRRGEF